MRQEVLDDELARLRGFWRRWWPAADHAAMAVDVTARLDAATETWDLVDVEPLSGGVVALVCAARRADEPVVLKVQARGHGEDILLSAEAVAVAHWGAHGLAPALLARRDRGLTLLLERVLPGTALDDRTPAPDERLEVLGGLVRRLHACDPVPDGVQHAGTLVRDWRRVLAGRPELAELDALLVPDVDDVLLHADLHGGNALAAGDGGWRVIDPHAMIGDRHIDVWALLDPARDDLPEDPAAARARARADVTHYAHAAGLDPDRAATWVRLRALIAALDIDAQPVTDPAETLWRDRLHRLVDALG